MKRHITLGAILLACACRPSSRDVRSVSIAPVATVSATASAKPVADATCARVMSEQRLALVRAIAPARATDAERWKNAKTRDEDVIAKLGESGAACFPFTGGAWSLEISEIQIDPFGPTIGGKLVPVAYVHGARLTSEAIQIGYGTITSLMATDYDGDGIPELYVELYTMGPEGGTSVNAKLLTAKDSIVSYPGAAAITMSGKPIDVDGDGRLDLPTSDSLSLYPEDACEGKEYGTGARLIAHSLANGGFSTDDSVAKNFARRWCPSAPTQIGSTTDALCARLRAHTPSEIAAARKRVTACVQWDCDRVGQQLAQPKDAIHDCTARRETFDQSVPFTL